MAIVAQALIISSESVDFDPMDRCVYTHGYNETFDEHTTPFCIAVFSCSIQAGKDKNSTIDIFLAANFARLTGYPGNSNLRWPWNGLGMASFQIFFGINLDRSNITDTRRVIANSKSAILFPGANLVAFTRVFTKQSFKNSAISSFGLINVST